MNQTESEAKIARYRRVEIEADAFGRLIAVRRLKPSEQTRITEYTDQLTGSDEVDTPDGKVMVGHRMPLILAASVCKIDDDVIPFPRNRGELDAIYDRLDVEGIKAAGAAMVRLAADSVADPEQAAKNLSGTPSSA